MQTEVEIKADECLDCGLSAANRHKHPNHFLTVITSTLQMEAKSPSKRLYPPTRLHGIKTLKATIPAMRN